ncbi:MAG: helix-turn-helix domain-containing protein [Treponema sp.]|jgi:excisionase family DNA binding protein|nr:helix-turn-helix domain-containing protein [Treponema sp.]
MEYLIDIAELARRTTIKQATLRKYVAQHKIPFVKIGRLVRFDLSEIDVWIKERKVPASKGDKTAREISENRLFNGQETPEFGHSTRFFPTA